MKINFYKAAEELKISPLALMLELAPQVKPFENIFPELDSGFVESIKQKHGEQFFEKEKKKKDDVKINIPKLSKSAIKIILHLERHSYWGSHYVPKEEINKRCKGIENINDVVNELHQDNFVKLHKGNKTVSLNPSKKKIINLIVEIHRK